MGPRVYMEGLEKNKNSCSCLESKHDPPVVLSAAQPLRHLGLLGIIYALLSFSIASKFPSRCISILSHLSNNR
jgi:hypothetical protein